MLSKIQPRSRPTILHKCVPLNEWFHWANLTNLFVNSCIRFSRLDELNDPFEGAPRFAMRHTDRNKQIDALYDHYKDKPELTGGTIGTELREIFERANLSTMEQSIRTNMLAELRKTIWVYCLSEHEESISLWSHYAANHSGVCLHFKTDGLPFNTAFDVRYVDERPIEYYPRLPDEDAREVLDRAALFKSTAWQGELEWRIVVFENLGAKSMLGRWDSQRQLLFIPRSALIGLTLGANMDVAKRKEVFELVRAHRPETWVRQAIYDRDRFGLKFEQVKP